MLTRCSAIVRAKTTANCTLDPHLRFGFENSIDQEHGARADHLLRPNTSSIFRRDEMSDAFFDAVDLRRDAQGMLLDIERLPQRVRTHGPVR